MIAALQVLLAVALLGAGLPSGAQTRTGGINDALEALTGASAPASSGIAREIYGAAPELAADAPLAAKVGDHIVLGLRNYGLENTASQVGGRTLLSDPNWKRSLVNSIADPKDEVLGERRWPRGLLDRREGHEGRAAGDQAGRNPDQLGDVAALPGGEAEGCHLLGARRSGSEPIPMITIIAAEGRVEWWLYTVSHGQLLLRRPKSPSHPRRLDILFKDVAEAQVFAYFDNLRVAEIQPGDEGFDPAAAGTRKLFSLAADNAVGRIVAGVVVHAEDDLEYDEPSSLIA